MLASAGIITAVPLALYGYAAVRIPLSYIGMLQYVSPTMTFIIGVFINHEPMPQARLIGFFFVWVALSVLSFDMVRHMRSIRTLPLEAS
jgi:chloramphenicol-sensitive protein RarD